MTKIHTIDLNYLGTPRAIASYILINDAGPVMIETGPGTSSGALAAGLAELGYTPSDIKHVLVTHIHFDHAGASGWMAQHGAHVYVHHFGYRHLHDPAKLNASAKRIYKDKMDEKWGELIPIPETQLTALHDGDVLELENISIRVLETIGHARHHHAYVVEAEGEKVGFTGDCGAMCVDNGRYVSIPTPPPEFDLEVWLAGVDRLEAEQFDRLYPTHFGEITDVPAHLETIRRVLHGHTRFVREMMDRNTEMADMVNQYRAWFRAQGAAAQLDAAEMEFYVDSMAEMNVAGIVRYYTKLVETAGT